MVGHVARRVTNIRIRKKLNDQVTLVNLPLHRVELEVKDNNREVLDLTALLYTKIKVELPKKVGGIPQCKRCQGIGHSQNYCRRLPRCVKCGGEHASSAFTEPKDSKRRCANCNGEHTANYKGCPKYQARLAPSQKTTATDRLREPGTSYAAAVAAAITNPPTQSLETQSPTSSSSQLQQPAESQLTATDLV